MIDDAVCRSKFMRISGRTKGAVHSHRQTQPYCRCISRHVSAAIEIQINVLYLIRRFNVASSWSSLEVDMVLLRSMTMNFARKVAKTFVVKSGYQKFSLPVPFDL